MYTSDNVEPPGETDVFFRIFLSSLQVNGIIVSYAFDWEAQLDGFFNTQNDITSLSVGFFKLSCVAPIREGNEFFAMLLLYALSVPVLSFAFGLCIYAYLAVRSQYPANSTQSQSQHVWKKTRVLLVRVTVILTFIFYPNICDTTIKAFSCHRLGKAAMQSTYYKI